MDTNIQRTALAFGLPLDMEIIAEILDRLCSRFGVSPLPAAILLDSNRRGLDMKTMAVSGIDAIRCRATSSNADAMELLSDLASTASAWRLHDFYSDRQLTALFEDLLSAADFEDVDVFSWLDALVSMDREGFTLEWLAKKLSAAQEIAWRDVLTSADSLIAQRLQAA